MDIQRLATPLREAFPTVAILTPLTVLGEGFGSLVVETANGVVFRIAKHPEAQRGHERERRVLPIVQRSAFGLRVPEMQYSLESSNAFPYGVVGYAKLPGRSLSPDDIHSGNRAPFAGQVAQFLSALHSIDVGDVQRAGLPEFPPPHARLLDLWQNVSAYLERRLSRTEFGQMQRWQKDLFAYGQRYPNSPTLVHGDCWYENMLFDEERQRLIGMIDFENVSIGDAAIDLATQQYLGDKFAQEVISAYHQHHGSSDLPERIKKLLGLRELLGLEQGITTGTVDEDALEKVRNAILSAP